MLKSRFPWIRKIHMILTDDKKSLKRILKYMDACMILHNMLIIHNADDADEWETQSQESRHDDPTRCPEKDLLDLPIPAGAKPSTRREQLKDYMYAVYVPKHNYRRCDEEYDLVGDGEYDCSDKSMESSDEDCNESMMSIDGHEC